MIFKYTMKEEIQMRNNCNQKKISKIWFIPLVIVISVVPLIMMVHGYKNELTSHPWFGNVDMSYDLYLYYKSLLIKTCGAIVIVLVVGLYIKSKPSFIYEKRSAPIMVALFVFLSFTILSSLLSNHTWEASFGGFDRFEGCYVIISYVFFFYFVFGYARSIKLIQFLIDVLMVGAILLSIIGVIESFGVNIYDWDWIQSLIFLLEPNDSLVATFKTNSACSTLTNPNYVGSYVPLVLPYCIYNLFFVKGLVRKIASGVAVELLCIFLYGSESDTGLVSVAVGIFVALFLCFPNLKKKSKLAITIIGGAGFVIIVVALMLGEFNKHFFINQDTYSIDNMETIYNSVVISTNNNKKIRVTLNERLIQDDGWSKRYDVEQIMSVIDDKSGRSLETKSNDDKSVSICDKDYPNLTFYLQCKTIPKESSRKGEDEILDVFHINEGEHDFSFGNILGGNLCYLFYNNHYRVLLRNIERIGFEGKYGFANGRGYIWACTLPLLKNHIILGAGQDNFIYEFPNDDYVGKKNSGFERIFISKPHNTFLGIWVQQGLVALLAYLFLYTLFMIRVVRMSYGKNRNVYKHDAGSYVVTIVTAIATSSYMAAGLANDTDVGVTPIYWVMLGVGYAAEAICRKKADPSDDATKELPDVSGIIGDEDDIIVEDTTFEEL